MAMRDETSQSSKVSDEPVELGDLAARARRRREDGEGPAGRQAPSEILVVKDGTEDARRLCRDCDYDLTGIDWSPAMCPECGREFDMDDPATTKAEGEVGRVRTFVRAYGGPITIGLLLLAGFQTTILPRPADLRDWRLWMWLGGMYGVEKVPGSAYRGWGSPYSGAPRGYVHWWGERPWRVEATTPQGDSRWEIQRISERHWRVETYEPDVMVQELLTTFTAIKPEMFGVQYNNRTAYALAENTRIEGSTAQVFGQLIGSSGLQLTAFLFRADQPYVWVFDEARGEMVTVSLDEAAERGLEVTIDSTERFIDRPIVPPPGDGPTS